METGKGISEELIEEVLAVVFPQNQLPNRTTPTIRYNRPHLQSFCPNFCRESTPTINLRTNPSKFENFRAYIPGKIRGFREGINCHWCGETGHVKSTCFKKQAFDNTNGKTPNTNTFHYPSCSSRFSQIPRPIDPRPVEPTTPFVTYDIDFDIILKGLKSFTQPKIPIDKLLQLRAVVNTLIYFHPSQCKVKEFREKLF